MSAPRIWVVEREQTAPEETARAVKGVCVTEPVADAMIAQWQAEDATPPPTPEGEEPAPLKVATYTKTEVGCW